MTAKPRNRRALILTAAADLFHRNGCHRMSTADIADELLASVTGGRVPAARLWSTPTVRG